MLKERGEEKARGMFHPKCRSKRRKVRSLLLCIIYLFIYLVFFFFLLLENKKTPSSSSFVFLFLFAAKKVTTSMSLPIFVILFFVMNKTITTSLMPSQKISFLPTSPLLPTYFTSYCAHFIVRTLESLKREDRRGRAELGTRSRRVEVATKRKHLKWEGRTRA